MIRAITLHLEQPLQAATTVRSDRVNQTQHHVPGWTLRGAFAAAWIAEHGPPGPVSTDRTRFVDLFEGGVRFGPCYYRQPPRSLSILGHKYAPSATCPQVEIDQVDSSANPGQCPDCGQPWEPVRGLDLDDRPAVTRRTHVHLTDDDRHIDGALFDRDALRRGQTLTGTVSGPPDLLQELARLPRLSIGGRRTTHGMTTVTVGDTTPELGPGHEYAADGFVIRLLSPAVFVSDTGRPTLVPNPNELEQVLGAPATVVRSWARWEEVGGWHAASGLPKPTEAAAAAGSTYVVSRTDGVSVPPSTLHRLLERGLGLRRHEGFGHLRAGSDVRLPPSAVAKEAANLIHLRAHPEIRAALRDHAHGVPDAAEQALTLAQVADGSDRLMLVTTQTRRMASRDPRLLLAVLEHLDHLDEEAP